MLARGYNNTHCLLQHQQYFKNCNPLSLSSHLSSSGKLNLSDTPPTYFTVWSHSVSTFIIISILTFTFTTLIAVFRLSAHCSDCRDPRLGFLRWSTEYDHWLRSTTDILILLSPLLLAIVISTGWVVGWEAYKCNVNVTRTTLHYHWLPYGMMIYFCRQVRPIHL